MNFRAQLKHLFNWNRHYYYLSFAVSLFAFIWSVFTPFEFPLLSGTLILIAAVVCLLGFSRDNSSWKYLQSLPLSKRELFHLKLAESAVTFLPFTLWVILFQQIVWSIFSDDPFTIWSTLYIFFYYFAAVAYVSIWSFYKIYESNRSPYVKSDLKSYNYQLIRNGVFWLTGFMAALMLLGLALASLENYSPEALKKIVEFLSVFQSHWTFLGLGALGIVFEYRRVFRRWLDEKRSYREINWNAYRDVPLITVSLSAMFLVPGYFINKMPEKYGQSELVEAVYHNEVVRVKKLIKSGVDVNRVSTTGFSPLMVAAHLGNEKMFNLLLAAGASKRGTVWMGNELQGKDIVELSLMKGNLNIFKQLLTQGNLEYKFHGKTPLQVAAYYCHEEIIDHLLEKGANPNSVVKSGDHVGFTPLHLAAKNGCLNGVVSLIDHGADPFKKDKMGRIALNFAGSRRKELTYYLSRKSRVPAGK